MMLNEQKEHTTPHASTSLLDTLLSQTRLDAEATSLATTKQGVTALLGELLQSPAPIPKVDRQAVDAIIANIDETLSAQVNAILHHPQVQAMESAWRGLKALVDRIDFRENIVLEMLQVTKDELMEDFEDAPDITKSGLYQLVYSNEYGVFGGQPYGAMVGAFDVGPNGQDMELLRQCAAVASMAHAPFLTNASPRFFGSDTFDSLPHLKDLKSMMQSPALIKWHAFRDSEDSRYVGLCLPRFLLRLPYGPDGVPVKAFNFEEDVVGTHNHYLWGHASLALAARVAESFAKYRWCPHIIGPTSGGTVDNLPMHTFQAMGELQSKIPTEVLLTERREYELSEEGFIGLTYRKESDNACFFSANSAQRARSFGKTEEGLQAESNFRLSTQLPYMFIMTRLAHYVKVMQREQLGSFKERADLERELNIWLSQYVADMEDAAPGVRARRPLRRARIAVQDVEGQPGWYRCRLEVQPHLKYMGASFTLSLVGRLDKA
jgi:type VI secretion system protein ImpC